MLVLKFNASKIVKLTQFCRNPGERAMLQHLQISKQVSFQTMHISEDLTIIAVFRPGINSDFRSKRDVHSKLSPANMFILCSF